MQFLQKWKKSKTRKPLIIKGARRVGKTWLMKEFGRTEYHQTAYVNFKTSAYLKELFLLDYDIERIVDQIGLETGVNIRDLYA
ncbi:MAG: AAA family ATPase [Flavobacteriaceae bacterium]|nr:AAA family ATPase [Flavobacteriaceae bacterium]